MTKTQDPYASTLADAAIETHANVKVEFYTMTVEYTFEQMKQAKQIGIPTTVMSLIMLALLQNGMSSEEVQQYIAQGTKLGAHPRVTLKESDDNGLRIDTKKKDSPFMQLANSIMEPDDKPIIAVE